MAFSDEWNDQYANSQHISTWPWSHLVSMVYRYGPRPLEGARVLEIGCGAGANINFFNTVGAEYHGIDGSEVIINKLRAQYPQIADRLHVGDFTKALPEGEFDIIVDRGSLTHNHEQAIRNCLDMAYDRLCDKGRYLAADWFASDHTSYLEKDGEQGEDAFTRVNLKEGPMANLGRCHFSDWPHIEDLFRKFKIITADKNMRQKMIPQSRFVFSTWNFVAEK